MLVKANPPNLIPTKFSGYTVCTLQLYAITTNQASVSVDAENFEIGLKENEAYGLVANDVKRQKDEAYGGQATHGIETQKNEAYGQVTHDITILTNEAYGAFQSRTEDCYITVN